MSRPTPVTALLVIGAVVLLAGVIGCGGDTHQEPTRPKLTQLEQTLVAQYKYAFAATVLNSSHYRETLDGVDYLIQLCRRKPSAVYRTDDGTRTMRQIVEDGANTLREYRPELAAELQTVSDNRCR